MFILIKQKMGNTSSVETSTQSSNIENQKIMDNIISEYRIQNLELQKQNDSLKTINNTLRSEIIQIKNSDEHSKLTTKSLLYKNKNGEKNETKDDKILTHISTKAIEEYVEKMIADKDVNINYLPDFVEKQLYRNILKIVLNLLDHILNNSHVTFFNHEINFDLVPLPEYNTNSQTNPTTDPTMDPTV